MRWEQHNLSKLEICHLFMKNILLTLSNFIFLRNRLSVIESLVTTQRPVVNCGKVNFHQFLDMVTTQYSGIQKDKAELTRASFWELKVDNKKRQNIENSKPNIRNRKKSGK